MFGQLAFLIRPGRSALFCVSPRDVLATYGSLPPMAAMLEDVLDVIELHGADFGNVRLYDEATGTLRIAAQRNFDQDFLDHFATVDAADGSCCGLALRSEARTIIEAMGARVLTPAQTRERLKLR